MSPNFSFLQEKVRIGKKTLTYRQLYMPQAIKGAIIPLYDSENKTRVKKKSGKGYKWVNTILAKGVITDVYFRLKKDLTIEECCAEQGRDLPSLPEGIDILKIKYPNLKTFPYLSHSRILVLQESLYKKLPHTHPLYFPIFWQIQSALTIIEKSWRMLTKINTGNKPNGMIIRWKHIETVKQTPVTPSKKPKPPPPPPDLRDYFICNKG